MLGCWKITIIERDYGTLPRDVNGDIKWIQSVQGFRFIENENEEEVSKKRKRSRGGKKKKEKEKKPEEGRASFIFCMFPN